jgi:parallel beta-helix repeat protein
MRSVVFSCVLGSLLVTGAANAATYYVRSDGNDTADGRSPDTAWATLSKVNKTIFATSDIVLLREGDRFTGTLTVDWAGTSSAPAVVGAYYLKNGVATRGYASGRPMIDGSGAAVGPYDALLRVRANYVRVENIKVVSSAGRNIDVADSTGSAVVGCSTDTAWGSGIHFLRSTSPRIENNVVAHAGTAFKSGSDWGGAIELEQSTGASVKGNIVTESYGEGINTNASSGTIIESNYVYSVRAVGIYADASPDVTIRRNIVVGSTNAEYWRSSRSVGAGIVLNNEKYHYTTQLQSTFQTQRAKVYGNLVAFASSGIAIWGEYSLSSFDGLRIFNNTLVDNDVQMSVLSNPKPGSEFVNNILLSLSSGTRDVSGTDLGGMIAKSNYFSQGSPGGGYVNSANRFSGLKLAKMTGWRSISSREQITWRDFDLQDGSTTIGTGDEEPRSIATTSDTYQLDYNKYDHNQPMDMGGLRYGKIVVKQPAAPENLALN